MRLLYDQKFLTFVYYYQYTYIQRTNELLIRPDKVNLVRQSILTILHSFFGLPW